MGIKVKIKRTGITNLLALIPKVRKNIQEEVAVAVLNIESTAKELCPVDTGRLRAGINGQVNGLDGVVEVNVTYAPDVEFGNSRQKAQPFLFPAYEKERLRFVARLKAKNLFK